MNLKHPSRPLAVALMLLLVPITWAVATWTVEIALVVLFIAFYAVIQYATLYAVKAFTAPAEEPDDTDSLGYMRIALARMNLDIAKERRKTTVKWAERNPNHPRSTYARNAVEWDVLEAERDLDRTRNLEAGNPVESTDA